MFTAPTSQLCPFFKLQFHVIQVSAQYFMCLNTYIQIKHSIKIYNIHCIYKQSKCVPALTYKVHCGKRTLFSVKNTNNFILICCWLSFISICVTLINFFIFCIYLMRTIPQLLQIRFLNMFISSL